MPRLPPHIRFNRQLEVTLMAKNRALEDKVAVLRRAGDASAAAASTAAAEVVSLRQQLAVAEGQVKQLEAALGSRWRALNAWPFASFFLIAFRIHTGWQCISRCVCSLICSQ